MSIPIASISRTSVYTGIFFFWQVEEEGLYLTKQRQDLSNKRLLIVEKLNQLPSIRLYKPIALLRLPVSLHYRCFQDLFTVRV